MWSANGIPFINGLFGKSGGKTLTEGAIGAGGFSNVDGWSGTVIGGGFIPGVSKSGGKGTSEILGGPLLLILNKI